MQQKSAPTLTLILLLLAGLTLACGPLNLGDRLLQSPENSQSSISQPAPTTLSLTPTNKAKPAPPNDDETFDQVDSLILPELSGPELTLDTRHFRIHYTLFGDDAVNTTDNDDNGYPDYVDAVAETMEHIWQLQIEQLGWAAPPPDKGLGGDDRYDVYLANLSPEEAGYADGGLPETISGDNPHTSVIETRSSYSFLALDNDYAEDNDMDPLELMRSVAAHEFMHAIQFGYDGQEPAAWLWEATATWTQDELYDQLNDGNLDLESVFKSPDTCQLAYGGQERIEDEGHWYGMWIYLRYISEHYGPQTVRAIWEHARQVDGYAALDAALTEVGTTPEDVYHALALAMLTRDFEEGIDYPTVRLEGEVYLGQTFIPADGVGQIATDYVQIQATGWVTVRLKAMGLVGQVVAISQGQAYIFDMPNNQTTLDASMYDHVYLLVLNLNRAEDEFDCRKTTYTVNVQADVAKQPQAQIIPAPNFLSPQVEPLLEDYNDPDCEKNKAEAEGQQETSIDPPPHLQPTYLPLDYTFEQAYQLERAELDLDEADLVWLLPGSGPATIIDYYNSEDGFISIMASDSPYASLNDWLIALDYEAYPEEKQIISGTPIFITDLSEPGDTFSNITFIRNGQFISIDGSIPVTEMTRLVESMLTQ